MTTLVWILLLAVGDVPPVIYGPYPSMDACKTVLMSSVMSAYPRRQCLGVEIVK